MRYLNTRDVFLKNFKELDIQAVLSSNEEVMINEAFENDITWGGSLLGRFINSVIRKAKTEVNVFNIKSIAKRIEDEFIGLIADGFSEEQKIKVIEITAKMLLYDMYRTVFNLDSNGNKLPDDKKINELEKIDRLLGIEGENDGLIKTAELYIKSLSEDIKIGNDDKNTILRKLEDFYDELEKLKNYYSKKEEFITDVKDLLNITLDINKDYSVEKEKKEEKETNSEKKTGLTKDKLVVGNWYKYTTKQTKIWLVKLVNKDYTVQYGSDKSWGSKDDVINTTVKLQPNNVYVAQQTTPGDVFTGVLRTAGIGVDVSQLEELSEQPTIKPNTNIQPKQNSSTNKISKDDIIVGNIYNYTKNGIKKLVKVLSKEFQIDVKTNKAIKKLPNSNDIFVGLIDKDGKTVTSTYAINPDILSERKNLANFNIFFQNYISEDNSFDDVYYSDTRINKIKKDLDEVQSEYDEEDALEELENKIRKDLEGLDIEQLKEYMDNPDSNFSIFGKQLNEDGELDDLEEEIFNIVDVIKKLYSTFNKNTANLDKIKSSENIKKFIEVIQKIKSSGLNKNIDLSEFWNKIWGKDHENWKITQEDKKLRDEVDESKISINLVNEKGQDRLINIVRLFGKAYSCFASELIPSGRPGGRISTTTRNEYVYIGAGSPPQMSETSGPGYGPWANKRVFRIFSEIIEEKIIADNKYKKVLSSGAIKTTTGDTRTGNVLLEFMRNMIDENDLKNYSSNRSKFLTKYFDLDKKVEPLEASGYSNQVNQVDEGDKIEWISETRLDESNLKENTFIIIDCQIKRKDKEAKEEVIFGEIVGIKEGYILIKFQFNKTSIVSAYSGYQLNRLANNFKKSEGPNSAIWFGVFKIPIIRDQYTNISLIKSDKVNSEEPVVWTIRIIKPADIVGKTAGRGETAARPGMGILSKVDKEGKKTIIKNDKPNTLDINLVRDKTTKIDPIFSSLKTKLEKAELPEKGFKYEAGKDTTLT